MFIRTPYNYDMDEASRAAGFKSTEPSMAKQSFAEECDINTIVRRFGLTGELPQNVRMPTHGDFTAVTDFKTAMDALAAANEAFEAMPAHIRARFHNDTHEFVEFCSNDENRAEAEKLGLVPAKALPAAAAAPAAAAQEGAGAAQGGVKVPPQPEPAKAAPAASQ